jgi:Holliday junction resolvase RusA-like endonuclease
MNTTLFHTGDEFFKKFNISLESVITYTDFCQEPIFTRKEDIRFTPKAMLLRNSSHSMIWDEWIEEEDIDFCPWDCVHNIQKIYVKAVLQEFDHAEIAKWLLSLPRLEFNYPFLHVRSGNVACIFKGIPKSERSKGGKQRIKQEAKNLKLEIQKYFHAPDPDHVEMMIDIFSSHPKDLPDVDRLSISIMDAFEGVVYLNDKQVRRLQPRVIETETAYRRLECTSDPMALLKIENMPSGSLYPLANGELDYYVVRILTFNR